MDPVTIRPATDDDLDAIAALTRAKRHRLAEWSPQWWQVADGADELHPLWLGHLLASDGPVARVAADGAGAIVGCAISVPLADSWFVDDVAAASPDVLTPLLLAAVERPARTCVPTLDREGTTAANEAGLTLVSSYWIGPAAPTDPVGGSGPSGGGAIPVHTFGPAMADGARGDLLVEDPRGRVWGSGPLPPPPVYGDGRTVAVLTVVEGDDRVAALADARAVAADRGDVRVCLVVGHDDGHLAAVAADAGLTRTVDVWAWPD